MLFLRYSSALLPMISTAASDGCIQDPELFNDTIMNNIKYANFEATDERKSLSKSTYLYILFLLET